MDQAWGESRADRTEDFLDKRLKLYGNRNDPTSARSMLQFIPVHPLWTNQRAARCLEAKKKSSPHLASFMEELIVRRELTDNYTHYNPDGYDRLNGLYPQYDNNGWAQKTLRERAHQTTSAITFTHAMSSKRPKRTTSCGTLRNLKW